MFYHLYSVLTLKESVFFVLFSKLNNEFKLQNIQVLMVLNFFQVYCMLTFTTYCALKVTSETGWWKCDIKQSSGTDVLQV